MSRIKLGNYIFVAWIGDHSPRHVHVFKDKKCLVKWNIDSWTLMKGKNNMNARILALLEFLRDEGAFG
jgi:hypothetical protein